MTRIPYRWKYPDPVPDSISKELDTFSPPFQSILFRRGCKNTEDAHSLLLPEKPSFPLSLSLRNIDLACDLINKSLSNDHAIAVYGDYDTDGITSTALLTLALRKISAQVIPFIPDRINDGYGLCEKPIDDLYQKGARLLITVDNGIRSFSETAYAKSLGMDVIITDHHHPSAKMPDADAIINPKLPGDPYPNKNLAGVGVVYKLVCGLAEIYPEISPGDYLDLVALGTIADIVPLTGENRYLVKQGLSQINQDHRKSLDSLIRVAGLSNKIISSSDISFQIAPRINSSGRLSDLTDSDRLAPLDLLLSTDQVEYGELSQILENHNYRRKRFSQDMLNRIETQIAALDPLPHILISLESDNDLGISGIAAGHLVNKYYLPAIVGAKGPESTTASCRSIPEFNIISTLTSLGDLFTQFGGHTLAAGFTIENSNLQTFMQRIKDLAESELSNLDLHPSLDIDAVVTLSDLDRNFYSELRKLEPTGEGNPRPLLCIEDVSSSRLSKFGKSNDHLKMLINHGTQDYPAIAFGMGNLLNSLPDKFDIVCYFSENVYRGTKEFQLQIVDLKPTT